MWDFLVDTPELGQVSADISGVSTDCSKHINHHQGLVQWAK
jgi:hypothetical protein